VTPYARQGGEVVAAQLAKVGIVAKIQNVEWAQWLSGTYGSKNYDLTIISHVEPFDLGNFAREPLKDLDTVPPLRAFVPRF